MFALTGRIKPRGNSFGFPYFNHWTYANNEQVKVYKKQRNDINALQTHSLEPTQWKQISKKTLKQHAEIKQPYRNWLTDFQDNWWTGFYVSETYLCN